MTQPGGDKELVIGNKQLMSLFFVVVALCGVFFAMGYMIGRNSTHATLADASTGTPVPGGQRQQPEPPRETSASPADSAASTPPPADSSSTSATPAPEAGVQTTKPEPPTRTAPPTRTQGEEEPKAKPASTARVSVPEAGASYLQVTALPKSDAEAVVKTLREQSFPTILATSSKEGLYRVLVGPYHQTTQLSEAKSRLKSIGFGSAFVQKQ